MAEKKEGKIRLVIFQAMKFNTIKPRIFSQLMLLNIVGLFPLGTTGTCPHCSAKFASGGEEEKY